MTEFEFLLNDRIAKIQAIDAENDLNNNAYIAYSGGKDSSVLASLVDLALPGNIIPRVYINTGLEYKMILNYVRECAKKDPRIVIYNAGVNIKEMLQKKGYPFKNKEHSEKLATYQRSGMCKTVTDYLGLGKKETFLCPKMLRYQFQPNFDIKVSKRCCDELKKKPSKAWAKANNRPISMTGMRKGEGGLRQSIGGCTFFSEGKLYKFHPLFPLEEEWIDEYVKQRNIQLCELYYPPYNFERTGCVGCPFNVNLEEELNRLKRLLPTEEKRCEYIWKPVYDEYRRLNYRLKDKDDKNGK